MTDPTTPADEPRPSRARRRPRPSAAPGVPKPTGDDAPRTPPRRPSASDRKLTDALTNTYQTLGLVTTGIGMSRSDEAMTAFGTGILEHSEDAVAAWMELANQNDAVKQALIRFAQGSAVANLVGVHLSMVMPLLIARGMVPPFLGGTVAPSPSPNGSTGADHD